MPQLDHNPSGDPATFASIGTADSLNHRATISARMPSHGWDYRLGMRGGRAATAGRRRHEDAVATGVVIARWKV